MENAPILPQLSPTSKKAVTILALCVAALLIIVGIGAWFARDKFTQADKLMLRKTVEIELLKRDLAKSAAGYPELYKQIDQLKKEYAELEKKKQQIKIEYVKTKDSIAALPPDQQYGFFRTRLDSARTTGEW